MSWVESDPVLDEWADPMNCWQFALARGIVSGWLIGSNRLELGLNQHDIPVLVSLSRCRSAFRNKNDFIILIQRWQNIYTKLLYTKLYVKLNLFWLKVYWIWFCFISSSYILYFLTKISYYLSFTRTLYEWFTENTTKEN